MELGSEIKLGGSDTKTFISRVRIFLKVGSEWYES